MTIPPIPAEVPQLLSEAPRKRLRWFSVAMIVLFHAGLAILFLTDRSPGTDAALTGLPLDDAWIHLVYGRSVSEQFLPCYNDGVPEAGFTSPLWMLNCAVVHWAAKAFPISVVMCVKVIGILWAILMSLGAFDLVFTFTRCQWTALLAGLLTASTPPLVFSQISGMEICAAAACGLMALAAMGRDRATLSGWLFAAAIWARPEMFILVFLGIVFQVIAWRGRVLHKKLHLIKLLYPTLIACVVWVLYCQVVTGRPLPNTFYAKFTSDFPAGFLVIVKEMIWPLPMTYQGAGILLGVIGIIAIMRTSGAVGWTVATFPWLFFVGLACTRPFPSGCGPFFYWVRYVAPGVAFLAIPIAIGVRTIWSAKWTPISGRTRNASIRKWIMPVVSLLLLTATLLQHPRRIMTDRSQFAWNCQNMNEVQVELGRWLADNTSPGTVVAVNDAGALRYFSNRRIIDLLGLNNHHIVSDIAAVRRGAQSPENMKALLQAHRATCMVVFPSFFPQVFKNRELFRSSFTVVKVARSSNYTVAAKGSGQATMVVATLN